MSVLSHGVGTVCTLCYVYCCLVCSLMMNVDLKCADYISTCVAGSPESMVDIMKTLRVGFHSSCVLGCLSTGILGLLCAIAVVLPFYRWLTLSTKVKSE